MDMEGHVFIMRTSTNLAKCKFGFFKRLLGVETCPQVSYPRLFLGYRKSYIFEFKIFVWTLLEINIKVLVNLSI